MRNAIILGFNDSIWNQVETRRIILSRVMGTNITVKEYMEAVINYSFSENVTEDSDSIINLILKNRTND